MLTPEQRTEAAFDTDNYWLSQWAEYGTTELQNYLAKVAEFERYVSEHE